MSDLRTALLDIVDEETAVEFVDQIENANEEALTRIARAIDEVDSTEEALVDETVENTEEVEEVVDVEETVEEEEEEVVVDDVEIVLDESFVHDLVTSEEFGVEIRSIVDHVLSEMETRVRTLETEREVEQEFVQDTPVRAKRAVVSYRARTQETASDNGNNNEPQSLSDTSANTLDEAFG